MSKKLQIIIGLILIAIVPLWVVYISPEILKLPTNISVKGNMIHTENNRFDINSEWTGNTIAISSVNIKTARTSGNTSVLNSSFKVESLVGDTLFELNQSFHVDRKTRHNLPGASDLKGTSHILFPPNMSKKDINFWPAELGAPTVITYVGNKSIKNLNTYHFKATNTIVDDSPGFENLSLVPEKYKALSRVNIDLYVEPVTGIIVDYQDSGISYYADKDNKPVWDMDDWSNKYNDPTIIERIKEAKSKKVIYRSISLYIPALFAISGMSLIATGVLKRAVKKGTKKK